MLQATKWKLDLRAGEVVTGVGSGDFQGNECRQEVLTIYKCKQCDLKKYSAYKQTKQANATCVIFSNIVLTGSQN